MTSGEGGSGWETRCPRQSFCALQPLAPAPPSPKGESLEFQTRAILPFLKLIDFIRELQIETRRGGFEMSKQSCKREKGGGVRKGGRGGQTKRGGPAEVSFQPSGAASGHLCKDP